MTDEQLADLKEFIAALDLTTGAAGSHLTLKFGKVREVHLSEVAKTHPSLLSVNGRYSEFVSAEDAYRWAAGLLILLAEDEREEA